MKKKTLIIILVLAVGFVGGCTESYSSPGTHITHHYRSNTPNQDLTRAINGMVGNSPNSKRYQDSMNSAALMDALSNLSY